MEEVAKTVYEQLRAVGVQCDKPCFYRGLIELIKVERGTLSIEKRKDGKLEYSLIYVPEKYAKGIEIVMKNLGIERYIYSPAVNKP